MNFRLVRANLTYRRQRQARLFLAGGSLARLRPGKRGSRSVRGTHTIAVITCLGAAFAVGACGAATSGAPATPTLLGVLDGGGTGALGNQPVGCAEIPPGTTGGFRVLPAEAVRLRVAAAWPSADLVVNANGTDLEKVGPSDTQRQADLRAAGTAYWIPENIDPNPTPPAWTVDVELPPSMRAGSLTLALTSRTSSGASSSPLTVNFIEDMRADAPAFNRVQLNWRDRGDEQKYQLQRRQDQQPYANLVSIGQNASSYTDTTVSGNSHYSYRLIAQNCGPSGSGSSISTVDVTTPKQTGVETIVLFHSASEPDQFVYTDPLSIFMPEDAVVTSVTNVAQTVNGDVAVPLENVRHTDAHGTSRSLPAAACPTAPLAPQDSTSQFDDLTVEGEWSVRAVCISKALLGDHIDLRIAWTQP